MLNYAKKCVMHPTNARFFPRNKNASVNPIIHQREPFQVNFARTEVYKRSTIPTCQRLLNTYYAEHPVPGEHGAVPGPAGPGVGAGAEGPAAGVEGGGQRRRGPG